MYSAAQPSMQPHTMQFFQYPSNTDQATSLPQAFSSLTLQDLANSERYMDIRANAHLHSIRGILYSFSNKCNNFSVLVGNGSRIPVTNVGQSTLGHNPFRTLHLHNVLITP